MDAKYFVRPGMSKEQFDIIQSSILDLSMDEYKRIWDMGYESWNDYILWNIDSNRVYHIDRDYRFSYPRKKNNQAVIVSRRNEYYESYEWRYRSNKVLYSFNFICVACGGTANQCHHQDWSKKFGNYIRIGCNDEEDEIKVLVPICQHCHTVVTNIQNRRRWIKTPRKIDIVLKAYQFPKPVTLFDRMDH